MTDRRQRIYLAGPISGLTYERSALGWRERVRELLPEFNLISPMRGKDFLAGRGPLVGAYADFPMSSVNGILGRDRNDVFTCDLVLACFLEADGNFSLGTAMEFGWADAMRKPIIMIARPEDPHRRHPMLLGAAVYSVDELEQGAELARFLLAPYNDVSK
jgi:nucleoside 2-deoxyribosyltransferase